MSKSVSYPGSPNLLEPPREDRAHGIQVNVLHGGSHGSVREYGAGPDPLFEKVADGALFVIGAARDSLLEELHEGRNRAEFPAHVSQSFLFRQERLAMFCEKHRC